MLKQNKQMMFHQNYFLQGIFKNLNNYKAVKIMMDPKNFTFKDTKELPTTSAVL